MGPPIPLKQFLPTESSIRRIPTEEPPTMRRFGNPTPVGLGGFLLANTPATLMLLGWHGAGGSSGSEAAAVGAFFYLGCLLEVICGIGEWINGETFNAAVFLILGGYFGASGAALVPFYNATAGYGTDSAVAAAAYNDSSAMLLIFMGVLSLFFTIASIRLDICHVVLFACFTAAYAWRVKAGVSSLVGSVILWYLFLGSLLEAVDFPYRLPVGDLSKLVISRSEYLAQRRYKNSPPC